MNTVARGPRRYSVLPKIRARSELAPRFGSKAGPLIYGRFIARFTRQPTRVLNFRALLPSSAHCGAQPLPHSGPFTALILPLPHPPPARLFRPYFPRDRYILPLAATGLKTFQRCGRWQTRTVDEDISPGQLPIPKCLSRRPPQPTGARPCHRVLILPLGGEFLPRRPALRTLFPENAKRRRRWGEGEATRE